MKTIVAEIPQIYEIAADQIAAAIRKKPTAVLALAAGRTTRGVYAELVRRCRAGEISFREAQVFAVTEFEDVSAEMSCRRMLEDGFLSKVDIPAENCHFLTKENLEQYDAQIAETGGLDLAVLGLGVNAHIGFNEPATQFSTMSHRQKLTEKTRKQNAELFGSLEVVPVYGLTMGIKTLTEAREILVIATGEEKAQAVHKMLYGRNDSVVPAAFLQIPSEVSVYVDIAAGAEL